MSSRKTQLLIFACAVLMFLPVIGGLGFSRSTDNRYSDRHRSMSLSGKPLGFAGEPQSILILLTGLGLISSAIFWQSRRMKLEDQPSCLTLVEVTDGSDDFPDQKAA